MASMVLREGAVMTMIGVALGVAGAWSSSRLIASFLYGIQPNDTLAFVAGPVMLAVVAVVRVRDSRTPRRTRVNVGGASLRLMRPVRLLSA